MASKYIEIKKDVPSRSERALDGRIDGAIDRSGRKRPNMTALTSQKRSVDSGLAMWRTRMQPLMMQMFLDPKNGMSYERIATEVNARSVEMGYDYVVTKSMVEADVRNGLKGEIRKHEGEKDSVFSAAGEALKEVIRDCWEDYEKSESVDAKSEASMLRTLIKDAGMSYKEAMVEIEKKRYAGDSDHLRVMMEALERYAGMYGLSVKGASVALQGQQGGQQQNQTGNIINYNFSDVDKEKMKDLARFLQDRKFDEMKGNVPTVEAPEEQEVDNG